MQTIATNIHINASTQFTNYDFNSMFAFNGKLWGCGENGLRILNTGDDDAGTDIVGYITLGSVDMGEMYRRIRYVYLGLQGDGDLVMTVTTDLNTVRTYPIALNGDLQQRVRVQLDRSVKGRYWDFKIANDAGSDFSIDYIQLFYF